MGIGSGGIKKSCPDIPGGGTVLMGEEKEAYSINEIIETLTKMYEKLRKEIQDKEKENDRYRNG